MRAWVNEEKSHATRLGHVRETGVRQRGEVNAQDCRRSFFCRSYVRSFAPNRAGARDVYGDRRRTRAASCGLFDHDGEPPVDGLHPDAQRQGAREKEGRRHRDRKVSENLIAFWLPQFPVGICHRSIRLFSSHLLPLRNLLRFGFVLFMLICTIVQDTS